VLDLPVPGERFELPTNDLQYRFQALNDLGNSANRVLFEASYLKRANRILVGDKGPEPNQRTFYLRPGMSAIGCKADMAIAVRNVCSWPKADMLCKKYIQQNGCLEIKFH
jgi:hypothetical protein